MVARTINHHFITILRHKASKLFKMLTVLALLPHSILPCSVAMSLHCYATPLIHHFFSTSLCCYLTMLLPCSIPTFTIAISLCCYLVPLLHHSIAMSLCCSVPLLHRSIVPLLPSSIATSLRCYVAPPLGCSIAT